MFQINFDGGFKFNAYPVKFTEISEKKTKELVMTVEMPLNASEILYGPIHLSWQVKLIYLVKGKLLCK